MRNRIRLILEIVAALTFGVGCIIMIATCFKVFIFEGYDPTDGVKTFGLMILISMCIYGIRAIIRPEYNYDRGYSDFGTNCSECYENMDDCKCLEDAPVSLCGRAGCNKEHNIGDTVRYDKNYNTYCLDCSDGIATIGENTLEACWFNSDS